MNNEYNLATLFLYLRKFKILALFPIVHRSKKCQVGLVWFYNISTIVGYLMPNPLVHIYRREICFVNIYCS